MRHRIKHRKLNRTTSHRRALRRNMAQSLFEHGRITTTLPKAKDMRPFVEKLITLAKRVNAGSKSARIRLVRLLGDRAIIPSEHQAAYTEMTDAKRAKVLRSRSGRRYRTGEPTKGMNFTAESVMHRLVTTVAPRYVDRPGGYTRVIKLGKPRLGDAAATAVLQLVGEEEGPGSLPRPEKTARQRRVERRYAFFARAMRSAGKGKGPAAPETDEAAAAPAKADESVAQAGAETPEAEEKKDQTAE